MEIFLLNIKRLLFIFSLLGCFVIVIHGGNTFKYLIFLLSLCSILVSIYKFRNINFLKNEKGILIPWGPWILCTIILMFIHGTKDLTQYINAFLIIGALSAGLYQFKLERKMLAMFISFGLAIIDSVILLNLYRNGLSDNILYTNKNLLIPVVTFQTIALISTLCVHGKEFGKKEIAFFVLIIFFSLVITILTEVRNAILAYGACSVVFFIFGDKKTRKFSIHFGLIFISLLFFSYMTGRLQSGIEDLSQLQKGNAYTSWGLRIEMWKFGLHGFALSPIFGWGANPSDAIIASGIQFPIKTWHIPHLHSDFIIALATGGLVMVLGWLSTIVSLIKNSMNDLPRLCLLASILATGLVERHWFEQDALFPFVILWTLFYLTDSSRAQKTV